MNILKKSISIFELLTCNVTQRMFYALYPPFYQVRTIRQKKMRRTLIFLKKLVFSYRERILQINVKL